MEISMFAIEFSICHARITSLHPSDPWFQPPTNAGLFGSSSRTGRSFEIFEPSQLTNKSPLGGTGTISLYELLSFTDSVENPAATKSPFPPIFFDRTSWV